MKNFEQQINSIIESHTWLALRACAHSFTKAHGLKASTATRTTLVTYPMGAGRSEYLDKFIRVDAF
jgi:hypothetical protein